MKKRIVLLGLTVLLAAATNAGAAEIISADGILSFTAQEDEWKEKEDPDHGFVISDGENTIMVDHYSNGETLPPVDVTEEDGEAVCQAFLSTRNEVFVVTGLAASREELEHVMKMIGTIKVLKYDTKTAVVKETETGQANEPGIRQINAGYFVTANELNVRSSASTDAEVIGAVYYGEAVRVTGVVTKDGTDTGWYRIQYNGTTGYVSSAFLSETEPVKETAGQGQTEAGNMEQCQYCGEWFELGDEYRDHLLGHTMEDMPLD